MICCVHMESFSAHCDSLVAGAHVCVSLKPESCPFQNDDEEDEEEEGDDAEELLGKGARSAALLADRTRVSAMCAHVWSTATGVHFDCVALPVCVDD